MRPSLVVLLVERLRREFTALDLVELLAVLRAEFLTRGDTCAANYCSRAAKAHADFVVSPEAPSDNGSRAPGDSEAGV